MAEIGFDAIFEGKDAQKFLEQVQDKAKKTPKEMKKLSAAISAKVFQDIMDHFNKEEGHDGPWADWSESYAALMESLGNSGNKILQGRPARLRNSFLPGNYKVETGGILFFNPAKTNTGFPYAYAHDTGGPILPQRSFMYLSREGLDNVAQVTLGWLTEDVD